MDFPYGAYAVIGCNRRRQPIHCRWCPILYVLIGNSRVACYVLAGIVIPCGLVSWSIVSQDTRVCSADRRCLLLWWKRFHASWNLPIHECSTSRFCLDVAFCICVNSCAEFPCSVLFRFHVPVYVFYVLSTLFRYDCQGLRDTICVLQLVNPIVWSPAILSFLVAGQS